MKKTNIDLAIAAYKGKISVTEIRDEMSVREHELNAIVENLKEYNPEIEITIDVISYIKSELM